MRIAASLKLPFARSRSFGRALGVTLVCVSSLSCGQNAFLESAKRDTDAALLFEAKKQMNGSQWTAAIDTLLRMSPTGRAERSAKTALASAYAGRCGLNLIRLADQLSNSSGSSGLFALFMTTMQSATTSSIADCVEAEEVLRSISADPASRSVDENLMLSFVEFSKMGAILSTYADTNDDGTADPSFDACDTGDIPEAMVRQFGTGMTLAIEGLNASGSSLGSALATAVSGACAALAGVDPAYDFCSITDPADFTADQVKALSGLIHSQDDPGLGTCTNPLAACVCP
jgi:hypothetical protein